jgi:hypothetical protein
MAFEKLPTIVITAIPKPSSARLPKPPQLPENTLEVAMLIPSENEIGRAGPPNDSREVDHVAVFGRYPEPFQYDSVQPSLRNQNQNGPHGTRPMLRVTHHSSASRICAMFIEDSP